ncbi:MAG: PAS domain S-box protein [Ignavibacteriae bacterium]|nr:PAS domain S-box protein [Ignavibacteriota bacterium]
MKNLRRFSLIKPRYIIVFGLVISLIMIFSSYIEFSQNKHEIYHMLDEHANSIIFSLDKSSVNTVIADREMENILTTHLLGVAYNIARLDSVSFLSNELLVRIAEENEVFRINVFGRNGKKEFSNYSPDSHHKNEIGRYSPNDFIDSVISGEKKEIIIGLKNARMEKGVRYAVAVSRPLKKGAIVVNLDAESFLEFRKKIGFEKTIADIGKKSGIEYIVLQNDNEIIASDKNYSELSAFKNDVFLMESYLNNNIASRIAEYEGRKVYEIVKSFTVENDKLGLFRIGLSMEEIKMLENKMLWRGIIISLVIIVIVLIVTAVIVSNQNYKMVSEEFLKIQTFTGDILDNMSQAVITVNRNDEIEIFNKNAENFFGLKQKNITGEKYKYVFAELKVISELIDKKENVRNFEFVISQEGKDEMIVSANTTVITDNNGNFSAFNIVLDDITLVKNAEKQKQMNDRLIAMGELASGVAHEVRNPLNSINMIAQRFEKENSDVMQPDEFKTLAGVLKSESSRVNNIIEQFLRFARPPKLNETEISSSDFLNEVKSICGLMTNEKGVELEIIELNSDIISIDTEQMKQVFINLVQNAVDAVSSQGKITITYRSRNGKRIFEVQDNGEGISRENIDNIFNLYYTTKPKGTGLGLSIVQQIISRHHGHIKAESNINSGTKFTIEL